MTTRGQVDVCCGRVSVSGAAGRATVGAAAGSAVRIL
jgi:hypothetical protein